MKHYFILGSIPARQWDETEDADIFIKEQPLFEGALLEHDDETDSPESLVMATVGYMEASKIDEESFIKLNEHYND